MRARLALGTRERTVRGIPSNPRRQRLRIDRRHPAQAPALGLSDPEGFHALPEAVAEGRGSGIPTPSVHCGREGLHTVLPGAPLDGALEDL